MKRGNRRGRLGHLPVLFLTSGIEDVEESNLVIDNALFPVRIWYTDTVRTERSAARGRCADPR